MAFGGGFGGGGFGGPGGGGFGGGGMGRLRSSLDAGDGQDVLGKIYDMKVLRRLPQYLAWVKSHIFLAATGTGLRTAANIAMPLMIRQIIDDMTTKDLSALNTGLLIYIGLVIVMWGGQYLESLQLSFAAQGILLKMRNQMFEHLHKLSMSFFDSNKVGKIMSRVQSDVEQLQTLLTQDILHLTADILTMIVIVIVMFTMNATLALITLSVAPVLVLVMVVWQNYARRTFIKVRQAIAEVNDNLQESISGVRVTQSLSREGVNMDSGNTLLLI